MSVSGLRSRLILLSLVVCASALNVAAATKRKQPKPSPAKQEQAAPAVAEVPPPAPLTPEQMPAVQPRVTYQNHQLTIVAENSTLGDIMREVRTQTGASIELPANANSRVVAHIGPGPSKDVLASLLNGTLFNYVLLGTVNDPSAVGKIILTQKPTGPDTQPAINAQPNMMGQQQNNYPGANVPGQSGDDQDPDTETEVDQPAPEQAEQPEQPAEAPNGQQPNLRTPEQLLQELQRQQQLQQQQQQGNTPGNQPEPPQ